MSGGQHPKSCHPFADGGYRRLFIDGKHVDALAGRKFESWNPATGELLATVAEGDARDVDLAVAAARAAFVGPWSKFKPFERQRILLALADLVERNFEELATLDTLDMGAPLSRTRAGQRRMLGLLRFYAGQATTIHGETIQNSAPGDYFTFTTKEPVGVVGAIIPWNAPLSASVWKIGPVLASGCTLVLKPAELAPLTSLRLAELALEAGAPPGVINVVTGFGQTAGAALAEHADVDKIAFTGSDATGQAIVRASAGNLKRVSLELGGKSPNIVFADADLVSAVPASAMAVFANTGQVCSAGSRLYVERPIYDEFVERVAAFASGLRVGDGINLETDIGPVISGHQLERVMRYIDIGKAEGAQVAGGGNHLNDGPFASGHFVAPTVLKQVNDTMRVAKEEIFGPVIAAIPFDDIDTLTERANATVFGLGGGVWTRDIGKAHRMAASIRAGTVWVNCYQNMDPAVPFGGYKMSGYGRESGIQHLDEYLNVKSVWINS